MMDRRAATSRAKRPFRGCWSRRSRGGWGGGQRAGDADSSEDHSTCPSLSSEISGLGTPSDVAERSSGTADWCRPTAPARGCIFQGWKGPRGLATRSSDDCGPIMMLELSFVAIGHWLSVSREPRPGAGPVRIDRENTKAQPELGAIQSLKREGERRTPGVITKGLSIHAFLSRSGSCLTDGIVHPYPLKYGQHRQGHIAFSATLMPTMVWTHPQLVTFLRKATRKRTRGPRGPRRCAFSQANWLVGEGTSLSSPLSVSGHACPLVPWLLIDSTPVWGEISTAIGSVRAWRAHPSCSMLEHRQRQLCPLAVINSRHHASQTYPKRQGCVNVGNLSLHCRASIRTAF
jgi:hypothetical protein